MPHLLFIAYWVPPRAAVGCIRANHLLKHLPEWGWDVTTLTARFENGAPPTPGARIVQTGYTDVKTAVKRAFGFGNRSAHEALRLELPAYGRRSLSQRFLAAAARAVAYPDDYVGWLPYLARAAKSLAASGAYDAVLSTAPPMTANTALAMAHLRIPWVADLRDLWAENDSEERSAFRARADDLLERAALSRATALTASSERSAARFRRRYPRTPCSAISTGFDEEEWCSVAFGREERCTLLYAGNLYRGKRDPAALFQALRRLLDAGDASARTLEAVFYCEREPWLMKQIAQYALEDVVSVRGTVSRREILAAERRADRLLIFSWDGPTAEGVVPGKLFEYFGARRRVLAIGGTPESTVDDLLRETGAGIRALQSEQIACEIRAALMEHAAGPRTTPAHSIAAFTAHECARRFSEVLDGVILSQHTNIRLPQRRPAVS